MLPEGRNDVMDFPQPTEMVSVSTLRSGPKRLEDAKVGSHSGRRQSSVRPGSTGPRRGWQMAQYGTQAPFLHEQYATADRLQARIDVHEGYSERKLDFYGIVLDELQLVPGLWLLDVGCGSGGYHPR